jgi:DNA-binding GntR family transcriptional regulator
MRGQLELSRTEAGRIRRSGKWQSIAEKLQSDIIFGRIHPREHLIEDDVMARFDVSRHAVRRAFDALLHLGLAIHEPNRGVYVRNYSPREVEDLYEIREMLEMRAAERIPLPVGEDLVERLSLIQQRHEQASLQGRLVEVSELNNEFHGTLYSACGNLALSQAIRTYSLNTQPIRMHYSTDAAWRKEAARDHWRIIEALGRCDRDSLVRLCCSHLLGPKRHYLQRYYSLS